MELGTKGSLRGELSWPVVKSSLTMYCEPALVTVLPPTVVVDGVLAM